MTPIEQFQTLSDACRETARDVAKLALEGSGRILSLNLDAAEAIVGAGTEQIKASWSAMAAIHSADAWPELVSGHVQRRANLNLALIDIASRMQGEMARLVELQVRTLRHAALDSVDNAPLLSGYRLSIAAQQGETEFVERKTRKAA